MSNPVSKLISVANDVAARVDAVIAQSPAADIEKNARQHFAHLLAKNGLVLREEYEIQVALLERAQAQLQKLATQVSDLEKRLGSEQ